MKYKQTIYKGKTPPSKNNLWLDTNENVIKKFNTNGKWEATGGGGITEEERQIIHDTPGYISEVKGGITALWDKYNEVANGKVSAIDLSKYKIGDTIPNAEKSVFYYGGHPAIPAHSIGYDEAGLKHIFICTNHVATPSGQGGTLFFDLKSTGTQYVLQAIYTPSNAPSRITELFVENVSANLKKLETRVTNIEKEINGIAALVDELNS